MIIESLCCPLTTFEWQTDTLPPIYEFDILLKERSITLKEVTIKAAISRFQQLGDTLIIKTDDVKTRPHADANALFDKIAGLQIGFGGRVSIMGKTVQEITIDGKKVFGGVPSITLNSIRADMIQEMELVQKTSASGQSTSTLNLKLKKNRKNGAFGDFSLGYGSSNNRLLGGNFSKIGEAGFTSAFLTNNTINERGLNTATFERMLFNSFRNSLNATSIIGLYDTKTNESDVDIQKLNQNLFGTNQFTNGGLNFTRKTKKSEFDGFIILDKSIQNLTQRQFSRRFFDNTIQQINQTNSQVNNSTNIIFNFNGKIQLSPKSTLRITDQINFNQRQASVFDTINSSFNQIYSDTRLLSSKNNNGNEWNHNLQTSWSLKGDRRGQNMTFYANLTQDMPKENLSFSNALSNVGFDKTQRQSIDREVSTTAIHLQLVQSIPLSKQFLFEGKISKITENKDLIQGNTIFGNKADTSILTHANIKNNFKDIGLYLLYQRPKLRIITGIAYWDWASEREKNKNTFSTNDQFLRVQLAKIDYQFSPQSSLSLGYSSNPVMPNWTNIVAVPDSSNLTTISTGNLSLKPYLQQRIELVTNQTLAKYLIFSLNLNYQTYQNYVISQNYFDTKIGAFSNTYGNSPKAVENIGINFSVFKISAKKVTWALFGGFNHLKTYLKTDNTLTPLTIDILFSSLGLKWKVNDRLLLNTDWNIQANRTQNSMNWSNTILIKSDWEMGCNWYFNAVSKLILVKNLNNSLNLQNFLDIDISKYLLKNNSLRISALAKNIFNLKNEVLINQNSNSQSILYNSVLPQTLLLKLTFYPESWK